MIRRPLFGGEMKDVKKWVWAVITLCLEILSFIVVNETLQWTLVFIAFIVFCYTLKCYLPKEHKDCFIEVFYTCFSLYRWENYQKLVSRKSRLRSRFCWRLFQIWLPLFILLVLIDTFF